MSDERVYCSDLCLASGEPMLGTAVEVDVWLLLEYKPTWKAKALEDNDLAEQTRAWIDRTLAAVAQTGRKARAQFIRRPELDVAETTLFIAEDGGLRRFQGEGYREIQQLDIDSADIEEVAEPHYFVCTNGQRDLCCARYGLPVYQELRGSVGARAWQTTHLGGHRFAPNVLVLPQGAVYGRVFADAARDFVSTIEAGGMSVDHLRGRSAYPPEAQVAETGIDGACTLLAVNGTTVTFETPAGPRGVDVEPAAAYEVIPSCGKTETETVLPLRLAED
ncbi:MAG: hypothetical protein F4X98_16660 [Gammaproteobacteria bacterium]|nr:hypothetical protein [Gammaproteobacteria bacterium]